MLKTVLAHIGCAYLFLDDWVQITYLDTRLLVPSTTESWRTATKLLNFANNKQKYAKLSISSLIRIVKCLIPKKIINM